MHADPPSRGRSRPRHRLSPALQTPAPRALRLVRATISRLLQTEAEESQVCTSPARLVRAGASRGRLRRDVCRVAHTALAMATSLSRLAGVAETRVSRRVDDRARGHETEEQNAHED